MKARVPFVIGGALLYAVGADGQGIARVVPGLGVDTVSAAWSDLSWHDAVPGIYRAWSLYLRSDPHLQAPTALWSASEQHQWPAYDLTASIAYRGFSATVLDIRPSRHGSTDEYVVKTLFTSASVAGQDLRPVALTRVYAIRRDGRWVFANALPRLTRDWQRVTVGPITYVLEPGRTLDRTRAQSAVAFADSLAASFGLPAIDGLTCYVASTPEELQRIMGVDWTLGGQGYGYALPWNRMILSSDAGFGEENRHELVHVVLSPLLAERRTHAIINEGIATWLGGSIGRSFSALIAEYAAFLGDHPEVTIDSILETNDPDEGWNPAGAMLALMVHEHGGTAALKELLTSGRSNEDLRSALVRLLGIPWPDILARWRERALTGAAASSQPVPAR